MFKQEIRDINGYHPQKEACAVVLDANESYINSPYNRYPDPVSTELRGLIGKKIGVSPEMIIAGNGSSEMIDLIMKCTLSTGDSVMTFGPTFSIYELNATILGGKTITYPLDASFRLNVEGFISEMIVRQPKLLILCNPNNPTGTVLKREEIIQIVEATNAALIVDEAYIEFGGESVVDLVETYPQLMVLRTLSKAYGLAGARVGYMVSCTDNINVINKVRPPYNLSVLAQAQGIEALQNTKEFESVIKEIVMERERISERLKAYVAVYPSGGNFLFFQTDFDGLYERLLELGVRIRKYSGVLAGYYRVTIGTRNENNQFIDAVEGIYGQ